MSQMGISVQDVQGTSLKPSNSLAFATVILPKQRVIYMRVVRSNIVGTIVEDTTRELMDTFDS